MLDYSVGSVNKILAVCEEEGLETALVMAFHMRNVRGGKGERQVFKDTLRVLYGKYPVLILDLLDLVPQFGCWDDLFRMAGVMDDAFMNRAVSIATLQLGRDMMLLDESDKSKISLCAKWAPRERSGARSETSAKHRNEKRMLNAMSNALFPIYNKQSKRKALYRCFVSKLNRHIKTVETMMCSGHWADINPASVPVRASNIYSHAFLNLSLDEHQLRRPNDSDRMKCRENFLAHKATEKATEKATGKATGKATEKATGKAMGKATEKATGKATEKEDLPATPIEVLFQELASPQYDIVRQRLDEFFDDQERQRVREFFRDREARGYAPGYEDEDDLYRD
jgi:hypothetical protein